MDRTPVHLVDTSYREILINGPGNELKLLAGLDLLPFFSLPVSVVRLGPGEGSSSHRIAALIRRDRRRERREQVNGHQRTAGVFFYEAKLVIYRKLLSEPFLWEFEQ